MVKSPVRSIVAAIAAAAARWSEPRFSRRKHAIEAVCSRTGYTFPTVEYAFTHLFDAMTRESLEAIVADELGCLDVLDDFVVRRGRTPVRALPAGRVCIISSRTTIGVAIIPAVFALCAKCEVLVKDREDHLAAAFFETVTDELADLRDAVSVRTWAGRSDAVALSDFDVVVAFGDDETLRTIASRLPLSTCFIPYGSRASVGYVTRDTLDNSESARLYARGAATDLLLYETEGCLSLHVLFAERGGRITPEQFGTILSEMIGVESANLQLACLDQRRAAQVAAARDRAVFRARGKTGVYSDPQASYLLVVDPPWDDPPYFLPRALAIYSVDHPAQAAAYLERHGIALEALGVTSFRRDLADVAQRAGAARVAMLGRLQSPPLDERHGGRPRIAEFVRWIADERIAVEP